MPTTPRAQTSSEEAKTVGRALKAMRESRELTQQEAADKAGITRNAWQNYEGGRAIILRSDVQRRIVGAIGGDLEELAMHAASIRAIGRRGPGAVINLQDRHRDYDAPGRGQAVFPLAEGEVVVSFPPDLSPEGFKEMAQYLTLFLRARGVELG